MEHEATIERWYKAHAILMIVATLLFLLTNQLFWIPAIGGLSFLYFVMTNHKNWSQITWFGGYPNLATGFRLILFLGVLIFQAQLSFFQIGVLASISVSFDGVDGYLSRKFNQASYFGSYFDRETDAFFVLAMTCLIFHHQLAGYWVLTAGLLRYIYVVSLFFFKPAGKKESKSNRGKIIAVILMISLIACFLVNEKIFLPALILSTILVLYSFGLSFLGMVRK